MSALTVTPIAGGTGVEITGVDLARSSDAERAAIRDVYDRNPIVVLRDQALSVEDYVTFGEALGELVPHTRLEYTVPGHPEVYVLSNKKQDGKMIGVHLDGLGWHSDGTYLARPLAATTLYALDVPPVGGDTLFADTCRAYDNLPETTKARIEDMVVVYDFIFYMQTRFPDYVVTERQRAENPEVRHRLVRRDAAGRPGLYMSNGSARGIDGMSDEEGRAFLRELTDFVTRPEQVYRHQWRAGDLVIWNNLQTMHSATMYDDQRYERLLHRLWVKAEG
ncbi:TauD/TfdA dioxygenase family protein [Tanticharoenia sakaeratensis]|uniref:Taurine catabolism dioxygenase TauD/TfdA n=1 Tax=Tanticharoenia sakaeratensis NBRC 103193 TaxID=1231623 RepID=A0A0D6MLW1_9PROT|nr:TauD/TfdA family dioxygenase [Tanticharoenia sakaeratensis]GAN54405.1 taurine catabolism dioxygenase TauD/TfdA [Tanticharoenia sakaeratensis NBRC 103193]GBQ18706.1 taurine catabolism dioxygenase TauD/TfdA [Tanticharoenia sakaeratensis NBRC 103193]